MHLKGIASAAVASVAGVMLITTAAHAGAYPTNTCVALKQKAAGKFCQSAAKAWAAFHSAPAADPMGTARDAAIAAAQTSLDAAWVKAQDKAMKKEVDCAVTTVDSTTAGTDLAAAVAALAGDVTAGLDTTASTDDAKCASKILGAAGKLCAGILKAESKHIKVLAKDPDSSGLAANTQKSVDKFNAVYTSGAALCAGTPALAPDIVTDVEATSDDLVFDTVTSPSLPGVFTEVPYDVGDTVDYNGETLTPICAKNTPYSFWFKRGTVNKLVMYYQGGGACWNGASCWLLNTFKQFARVRECEGGDNPGTNCTIDGDSVCTGGGTCGAYFSEDNPDLIDTGFARTSDPDNPFKDWNFVFVSYCTGDIHFGNQISNYGPGQTTRHLGRINAKVAEKFAREHFPNPEEVFVTGSSAGSYGAIFNSPFLMHDVYPASPTSVLGDGGVGVITQGWLNDSFSTWNFDSTLPTFIPAVEDVPAASLSMPEVIAALADFFPQNHFASYQTAYDGTGGGQSAFFNVMSNPDDVFQWPNWWQRTCEWNACMRQFVENIDDNTDNFHYYTGPGSAHTGFGFDKIYEDTTGGLPTFVDWINDMRAGALTWTSQHCGGTGVGAGCDLVDTCQGGVSRGLACTSNADCTSGTCALDPRPNPLAAPYEPAGVVNCGPTVCPCGTGDTDVVCGSLP